MPKVRTSDGFLVDWNKDKIVSQLQKESVLAKEFFNVSPMTKKEAELVSHIVENRVISMNLPFVSSSVVRELVNNTLLELSASDPDFLIYKNVMTRVGTPVYDAYKIDVGDGFEKNENANLQSNPETIHKKKADLMSKEQYLLLMQPDLANKHHSGDIHIHTLEYFGSRPFCLSKNNISIFKQNNDTKLTTIENIVSGLCFNEKNVVYPVGLNVLTQQGFSNIEKITRRKVDKLFRMSTERGYFVDLTKEHLIPTHESGIKDVESIKTNNNLYIINKEEKQYLLETTNIINGVKLTDDLCRFIGYFIADGHYNIKDKDFYNVVVTMDNNDPDMIQDINKIVTNMGYHITNFDQIKREMQETNIIVTQKEFYELLHDKLQISKQTSHEKTLPEWFLRLESHLQIQMLIGLFSGDGDFHFSRRSGIQFTYSSTSTKLIQQLQIIFRLMGIDTNTYPRIKEGTISTKKDGSKIETKYDVLTLQVCGRENVEKAIKEGLTIIGFEKYVASVSYVFNRKPTNSPTKVKDISELKYDNYVYDFYLDKTHTFYNGSGILVHNCQDWDLRYFLYYGFIADGLGYKSSVAGPPKHASVAILQSVKALAAGQTNFSGGQGYMYYTMFIAPYLRGLPYDEVKQLAQMMFFELTQTYIARGGQPVFSNIQIPMGVPKIWKDIPVVMKGKIGPDTYGSYEDEVQQFYRAIQEVSLKGDYWGKPFNFPKQENYVSPEFFKPEYDDLWLLAHQNVAKNGSPYFDNMIPEYRGYGNGISCYQCCAYQFSNTPENDEHFAEKLNFVDGQHFSMGGWQVVSINLPRLAYRANGDYDKLLEYAQEAMRNAIEVFKIKKKWMDSAIKQGTLPFATQKPKDINGKVGTQAVDFGELVYVIGVVGLNEMVQHFTGKQLHEDRDAVKLGVRLLIDMEKYRKGLQMKTGMKLSLARTPAESTAQTFAIQDLVHNDYKAMARPLIRGDLSYLDKINGRDVPLYYTNGTHVNVSAILPLSTKMDIEQKFFPILSGGNIFQIWLGECNPDPEGLYKITKGIVNSSQIGYFAYTKDLTICDKCGSTSGGLLNVCPNCGSIEVKNWSRITGYYSDVSGWNAGKKQELRDRYKMKI